MASRDITVGEVVAVEKAIVSHMLPEYMGKIKLKDKRYKSLKQRKKINITKYKGKLVIHIVFLFSSLTLPSLYL